MRPTVDQQVEIGALVCALTKQPLVRDGQFLRSTSHSYRLIGDVPVMLADQQQADEYTPSAPEQSASAGTNCLRSWLRNDYRTKQSIAAEQSVLDLADNALGLSIGGGPLRAHESFVNLNIGMFPNVDVVADAHLLPYADESVDAVFSEAVFEHLHTPAVAASEMRRVMKRGAKAFVATPFLQAYHGHPSHYQNYTLAGHRLLFERAGLRVLDSGVCVGPIVAMTSMAAAFCRNLLPPYVGAVGAAAAVLARAVVGPLDRVLANRENAHVLCSATYLVLQKAA